MPKLRPLVQRFSTDCSTGFGRERVRNMERKVSMILVPFLVVSSIMNVFLFLLLLVTFRRWHMTIVTLTLACQEVVRTRRNLEQLRSEFYA